MSTLMLNHVLSRIHFNQSPEVVLNYLSTTKYWPEWHVQSRRVEGVTDRPMQVGDKVVEYVESGNAQIMIEWTVVDRWESKMYRIDGREVKDGKVSDEITVAIHYTLFPTKDGGTDFTRDIEFIGPNPGAAIKSMEKPQNESLQNVKKILDAKSNG